jgi:ABC-type polysaccharide transport system permease subunit
MSYLDLLLLPAAILLVLVLQYALIFGWVLAVVLGRMARSVPTRSHVLAKNSRGA